MSELARRIVKYWRSVCDRDMYVADRIAMDDMIAEHDAEQQVEIDRLRAELANARKLIADIDATLRVPAAEYVPAIGDVFTLIDNNRRGGRRGM